MVSIEDCIESIELIQGTIDWMNKHEWSKAWLKEKLLLVDQQLSGVISELHALQLLTDAGDDVGRQPLNLPR